MDAYRRYRGWVRRNGSILALAETGRPYSLSKYIANIPLTTSIPQIAITEALAYLYFSLLFSFPRCRFQFSPQVFPL